MPQLAADPSDMASSSTALLRAAIAEALVVQQRELLPDLESFGRIESLLDVLKGQPSIATLRTVIALYDDLLASGNPSRRASLKTEDDAASLHSQTLQRIARHLKDRISSYVGFYSVAKRNIGDTELTHHARERLATIKDAIGSVKRLSASPTHPEEVHDTLRKVSAAAHSLVFLQQDQITAFEGRVLLLEKQLEAKDSRIRALTEENTKLTRQLKCRDVVEVLSDKPVLVAGAQANIVFKLSQLRRQVDYPNMTGVKGRRLDPLAWARSHLVGDGDNLLTPEEFDTALAKPTLFKPFNPRLYFSAVKFRKPQRQAPLARSSDQPRI